MKSVDTLGHNKKRVAIVQSNYIPWKGYFDLMGLSDEIILFDSVQYTKKNWRNRNRIKTKDGLKWISIPVRFHNSNPQPINQIKTANDLWRKKHWKSIQTNYSKAPYFREYSHIIKSLYLDSNENSLSKINYNFISAINEILGIKTKISFDTDYGYIHQKGQISSIIQLIISAKANIFLNGPTAKNYMDESKFKPFNIDLIWMDYGGYGEYNQLFQPFNHFVSILDLIFNTGPSAINYLKCSNVEKFYKDKLKYF
jgi:WbqC-like protein family